MNNPFSSLIRKVFPAKNLAVTTEVSQANQPFNPDKTRQSAKLQRTYTFKANLEMDVWKQAILQAENPILPNREVLYALYKEVMRDRHLKSQVNTRKLQVLGEEMVIIDKKTKQVDPALTELLQRPWFQQYSNMQLDATFWGHSLIEFQRMEPSQSGLLELEMSSVLLFPREYVKPEAGIIVLQPGQTSGIPYRENPFNEWLIEIGDPTNLGLLADLAPEVIWKLYSRSDWSRRSEKFGQPMLVVQTEETDQKELDKKEEFAATFGTNSYAIFDKNDVVDLKESKQPDAYKIYQEKAKFCNAEMSKLIVGQTMTADDGSSKSQADVHKQILEIYQKADMRVKQFEDNYILFPFLIRHGYPLEGKMVIYTKFLKQYQNPGVVEEDSTQSEEANQEQQKAGEKTKPGQEPTAEKKKKATPKKEAKQLNFY